MKVVVRPLDEPFIRGRRGEPAYPRVSSVPRDTRRRVLLLRLPLVKERQPAGTRLHRWVAVDEDGRVVGHLAATPSITGSAGSGLSPTRPATTWCIPGTLPGPLSDAQRSSRTTENCVACDMVPAVIGVESRLGAEVAGQLQYAAKLLNVSRLRRRRYLRRLGVMLNRGSTHTRPRVCDRPVPSMGTSGGTLWRARAPPSARPRAPIPAPAKSALEREGLRMLDEALGSGFGGGLRRR
jgi:hypothetical protein